MTRKKLNLAEWGQTHINITIRSCPKCDGLMDEVPAFGVICLTVCKKCKKFYGLVIEDVTAKLHPKFKKENL